VIRSDVIVLTTSAGGAATGVTQDFTGMLEALVYVPGTLATGADLTITDEVTGLALLTVTDAGTTVKQFTPRTPTVAADNSASLYAATGEPVEARYAIAGRIKVVVAQGGATLTGHLYVFWDD
jgi:hypothetical protein